MKDPANNKADICYAANNNGAWSNVSHANPGSRRCVAGDKLVENLTRVMQKFPNGLLLSKLASEYKVKYSYSLLFCRAYDMLP